MADVDHDLLKFCVNLFKGPRLRRITVLGHFQSGLVATPPALAALPGAEQDTVLLEILR